MRTLSLAAEVLAAATIVLGGAVLIALCLLI